MNLKLDDDYGLPWTAHVNVGWIILILALSSGMFALFLGLYLSLWMYQRARSTLPLICYVVSAASGLLLLLPLRLPLTSTFAAIAPLSWIIGSFSLRHEILEDARAQGFEREIGPIMTLFFSIVYLNYCLNPDIFPRSTKSDPISLHLRK